MFHARRPTDAAIEASLYRLRAAPFSHDHAGATKSAPPVGYTVDRYGVTLGSGLDTFDRACAALRRFEMYPAWASVVGVGDGDGDGDGDAVSVGTQFATVVKHLGFWSVNPCRVVYTFDEPGPAPRYGFAIGTLPGHSEAGEERFEVAYAAQSDSVRYDVLAFSRPHAWLARLGAPYARRLQRRFAVDACSAMQLAAAGRAEKPS